MKGRISMATLEEKTIDLEAQRALAVVERGNMSVRSLSMIHKSGLHWPGEDNIPMNTTEAQEIQLLKAFANYHVYTRNWDDTGRTLIRGSSIMYHWAIGLSGKRYKCRAERNVTWHINKGNYEAVGTVVLMGTRGRLTAAARDTLIQHLAWLDSRTDIGVSMSQHWGHGECGGIYGGGPSWNNATTCPGPELLELVRNYRKGAIVPGPISPPTPLPGPNTEFFPQTGHNLSNAFRDYWRNNGGLARFGYPLTEELSGNVYPFSVLPELKGYTVQLFERALLHYKDGEGVGIGRDGALALAVTSGGPNDSSDN